jgi:hypothetical protein
MGNPLEQNGQELSQNLQFLTNKKKGDLEKHGDHSNGDMKSELVWT